jgi:hypothetical protein
MPYRHAGPSLCTVCNGFTDGARCHRCGRPLCQEHAVPDGHRCVDCEAEYAQVATLVRSAPIGAIALQVVAMVSICLLLVMVGQLEAFSEIGPYLSLAGGVMTVIFLTSLGVILRRRLSVRGSFLAERSVGVAAPRRPAADPPVLPFPVRF